MLICIYEMFDPFFVVILVDSLPRFMGSYESCSFLA